MSKKAVVKFLSVSLWSCFVVVALVFSQELATVQAQSSPFSLSLSSITPNPAQATLNTTFTSRFRVGITPPPGGGRVEVTISSAGSSIATKCYNISTPASQFFEANFDLYRSGESTVSVTYNVLAHFVPLTCGIPQNASYPSEMFQSLNYVIEWRPSTHSVDIVAITPNPGQGYLGYSFDATFRITYNPGLTGSVRVAVNNQYGNNYCRDVSSSLTSPYIFDAPLTFSVSGGGPRSTSYRIWAHFVPIPCSATQNASYPTERFKYIDYGVMWNLPKITVSVAAFAENKLPLSCAKLQLLKNGSVVDGGEWTDPTTGLFTFPAQDNPPGQRWSVGVSLESHKGDGCNASFNVADQRFSSNGEQTVYFSKEVNSNNPGIQSLELRADDPGVSIVNVQTVPDYTIQKRLQKLSNLYAFVRLHEIWLTNTFGANLDNAPFKVFGYDVGPVNYAEWKNNVLHIGTGSTDGGSLAGYDITADVVFHELGHRAHQLLQGFPAIYERELDHNGFRNTSSSYGYLEGIANWTSITERNNAGLPYPKFLGFNDVVVNVADIKHRWNGASGIVQEGYVANEYAEEFAIAGILWDLSHQLGVNGSAILWKALPIGSGTYSGMTDVYTELKKKLVVTDKISLETLDRIFIEHGFFDDLNGTMAECDNPKFNVGEPVGPSKDACHTYRNDYPQRSLSINRASAAIEIKDGESPAQYGVKIAVKGGKPTAYKVKVDVKNAGPEASYEYTVLAAAFPDGLVKLYPPDTQYDTQISVTALTPGGATNPLVIEGQGFWGAVSEHPNNPVLSEVVLEVGGTEPVKFDQTPPVSTASLTCALPGNAGWCRSDIGVSFNATDDLSGVARIEYQIDGGSWISLPGKSALVTLTVEGVHTLSYRAVDKSKNVEVAHTLTFKIDKTPPTSVIKVVSYTTELITINYTVNDPAPGSGPARLHYIVRDASGSVVRIAEGGGGSFTVSSNAREVEMYGEDVAGNLEVNPHILRINRARPAASQLSDYQALGDGLGSRNCGNGLSKLVDTSPPGDNTSNDTYWCWTNNPKAVAVEIDLGGEHTLGAMWMFTHDVNKAPNTYFQYKDSTGKWSDIPGLSQVNTSVSYGLKPYLTQLITARNWRIVVDNTTYLYDLGYYSDLQLVSLTLDGLPLSGITGPQPRPTPHRLPIATASASTGDASQVLDNLGWTNWQVSARPKSAYIQLDLGQSRTITQLDYFVTYSAVAYHTRIEVSNDPTFNSGVTTLVKDANTGGYGTPPNPPTGPNPPYGSNSLVGVNPTLGRYIRITIDNPEGNWTIGGYGELNVVGY